MGRVQGSYFKFYLAPKFKQFRSSSLITSLTSYSYSADFLPQLLFSFCVCVVVVGEGSLFLR